MKKSIIEKQKKYIKESEKKVFEINKKLQMHFEIMMKGFGRRSETK